jgi:hypothetical protein
MKSLRTRITETWGKPWEHQNITKATGEGQSEVTVSWKLGEGGRVWSQREEGCGPKCQCPYELDIVLPHLKADL